MKIKERSDLLKRKGYWIAKIQLDLFNQLKDYKTKKGINSTELATEFGVTKGYISQVLNGNFDHKISKLVELCLKIGKVPKIEFVDIEKIISQDQENNFKPFNVTNQTVSNSINNLGILRDDENERLVSQFQFVIKTPI